MKTDFPILRKTLLFIISISLLIIGVNQVYSEELFPLYPGIKKNVIFWEHVYDTFTTKQGIVHDKDNLSIIYGVIQLKERRLPDSAQVNRQRIKRAKQKYRSILKRLATSQAPSTPEEHFVAMLFPNGNGRMYHKAMDNIRVQTGQKDRFLSGVIRSGAYIEEIKSIFSSYGLPDDLAYLPHVESSFHPKAYSRSGAVGAWQFIRSTGRQFMSINHAVDERYDPVLSAHAAARFLKQNFEKLGTWPLALTAYNYGQNGMLRAVREKKDFERIINEYRSKRFQFAAKNYYAEFLAALHVAKKYEADPAIRRITSDETITVRFPEHLLVRDLLRSVPVSLASFSKFNPALRESVLKGEKHIPENFPIRLPASTQIKEFAMTPSANLYSKKLQDKRSYEVRSGDTAGFIARQFNIPLSILVQVNGLNSNAEISSGQQLHIPVIESDDTKNKIVRLSKRVKRSPGG